MTIRIQADSSSSSEEEKIIENMYEEHEELPDFKTQKKIGNKVMPKTPEKKDTSPKTFEVIKVVKSSEKDKSDRDKSDKDNYSSDMSKLSTKRFLNTGSNEPILRSNDADSNKHKSVFRFNSKSEEIAEEALEEDSNMADSASDLNKMR